MAFKRDRVFVSSSILTICLLSLVPADLKFAATWQTRFWQVTDRVARLNYESSIAFASLALVIIGVIVIWTSYQKRMRWSWFVMLVFTCVYFVPVHLLDALLAMRRVGWPWWHLTLQGVIEGDQFSKLATRFLMTLVLMITALLLPVRAFFGKKRFLPTAGGPDSRP